MSIALARRGSVLRGRRTTSASVFKVGYNEPTRTGSWSEGTGEFYINSAGDVEILFTGTTISLYATLDSHHGIARVVVDGTAYTFDQYSATRVERGLAWSSPTLADAAHVVKVEWNGTRHVDSTGTTITFAGASVNSSAGDPYPGSVSSKILLDEQFDGSYSLDSGNNGAHPWIRCEPGDPTLTISSGTIKIPSMGSTGSRQISATRFGDVGKALRLTYRARVTDVSSNDPVNGTIPAFCTGIKFRCPSSQFPEDDWQSVRGYKNDGSPGSFIFRTGIGARGRLEQPRNKACVSGYEDNFYTSDIGYTLGTWVERTVLIEHLGTVSTDETWRVRYWDNSSQSGTPIFDKQVTHPTIEVKPAYLWLRTDQCDAEVDWIKVEDVTGDTEPAPAETTTPAVDYMAPAETFTGGVSAPWRVVTAVTVADQRASLSYADSSVLAGPFEDATGKTVSYEYVSHTATSGCEATVGIRVDSSNYAVWRVANGNLRAREEAAGVVSDVDLGTVSATSHHYQRVRHDSATDEMVWETSSDNAVWTEHRRKARAFVITSAYSRAGVFRFSGTGTGTFVVDSINKPGIPLAAWYPGGSAPSGTILERQQAARRSYDKFMDYCLATDGMPAGMPAGAYRIKSPNQGFHPTFTLNATVSEGIGYGMLLTAWMGNPNLPAGVRVSNAQAVFDGLWTYYKHFRNANGLMNWHINPDGTVAATGGASDGDFDVAMALVVAHRQWGTAGTANDYGADATALINAIRDFEFTPTTYTGVGGPNVMMNGDQWGVDTDRYMPDYFRPGWFREFQRHTGDTRWTDIIAKNYPIALGYFSTNFTGGVVPDGCTRASLANGVEAYTSGYNAVRWFGIIADLLYNGAGADALAHGMSDRMVTKGKTHWATGGAVKAPSYDLNLDGPFEAFSNSAGWGMFGLAALSASTHSTWAGEVLAAIDADTELSYFNRGQAAIASMLMAGIAQVDVNGA